MHFITSTRKDYFTPHHNHYLYVLFNKLGRYILLDYQGTIYFNMNLKYRLMGISLGHLCYSKYSLQT